MKQKEKKEGRRGEMEGGKGEGQEEGGKGGEG